MLTNHAVFGQIQPERGNLHLGGSGSRCRTAPECPTRGLRSCGRPMQELQVSTHFFSLDDFSLITYLELIGLSGLLFETCHVETAPTVSFLF